MTDQEKALFDKIQAQIKSDTEALTVEVKKGLVDTTTFTTKMGEINDKVAQIEQKSLDTTITDQITSLNEKFELMKTEQKANESVVDAITKDLVPMLKDLKETGRAVVKEITVKSDPVAVSMGVTTTTGAGVIQADHQLGINYAPQRQPMILNTILNGTTNSDTVTWVEKTDEVGAPAFKKEFETYPKRSWKTVLRTALVKDVTVYAEYHKNILEDLSGFDAELKRDLVEQIQLTLDTNLLRGEGGTSSDADHKGILEYAQVWDNGTFTVTDPQIYDVIAVGVNQVRKEHHNPTVICMSPSTAMQMKLTKDDNGNYVMPPFVAANGINVDGLPVLTNTLFNDGEILIMDGGKAEYKWRRNWTLEVTNSHAENFVKGVITVTLTGRGVLKIKTTDAKAFVHIASVSTAITALTPAS